MKNLLPIIIVGILVVSGLGAVAVQENGDETSFSARSIMISEPIITETNEYLTIDLEESESFLMETGKPMLPVITKVFTFPLGTKIVDVKVDFDTQKQVLSKKIQPSPRPVPLTNDLPVEKISTELVMDEEIYSSSALYPSEPYTIRKGAGISNGENVLFVNVRVTPQYSPADDILYVLQGEIEIEVLYELSQENQGDDEKYDLLIISPSDFSYELADLVTHKNNRGIATQHVWLEEIYNGDYFSVQGRDNPEKIKYFIKNAYDTWGISNVLLVGGIEQLPSRQTHIEVPEYGGEVFVSDLYYADIYNGSLEFSSWDTNHNDIFAEHNWDGKTDEIDLYPDVKIGRLACINSEQVQVIVNKIINYENNKAYAQDWFSELVVIGGDTAPGDDKGIDEGEFLNQAVINVMDGFNVRKIWDSNNQLSGLNPTGVRNINDAINNGCGFVDFSGHGASFIWTTYPHNSSILCLPTPTGGYTSRIIGRLKNDEKLPIIVCGGCSLGKFSVNKNCFAWSFLSNPDGGGIASFGATGSGYIYGGEDITYGLFEGLTLRIFEAYANGAISFGEMWVNAVNDYMNSLILGPRDLITLAEWQPFGDPTLVISTESLKPLKPPVPDGPSSGKVGIKYTYNASTTDPEGDDIYYFFEWSDVDNSGWLGPYKSGEICSTSHTWDKRGSYQIRVRARDEHGSISAWSEPLPVSMPKNPLLQNWQCSYLINRIIEHFPIVKKCWLTY